MNRNMQPYSKMSSGAMSMSLGGPQNAPCSESISHPRPSLTVAGNVKKKRRTNAKAPRLPMIPCPITQDLNHPSEVHLAYARPPQLSGYGDTMIASNPFDDMPSSASEMASMQSISRHSLPQNHHQQQQQQQLINGPRMTRRMLQMPSMDELSSIMGHNNMAPMSMNPSGNPMNLMDRLSAMNSASHQHSGSMGTMSNPMNNMGQNHSSSMHNMGQNQQSPINPMGNGMNCENPMTNMGQNQGINPLNNRASPMGNIGSNRASPMNMMGHPMDRISPIKSGASNQSQRSINAINSHMAGRINGQQMGNNMGRGIISSINGISGGNNHSQMENGPIDMGTMQNGMQSQSSNESLSMNNSGGPFSHNPAHLYSHDMGIHVNRGNLTRPINNSLNPMAHNNMNIPDFNNESNDPNIDRHSISIMSNDINVAQRNQMAMQMGGNSKWEMGSMGENIFDTIQDKHANNMVPENIPNHGFQPRGGMGQRIVPPSNEKVYPPDQHIIFNSQNRNAPPIYLCGSCHKEVHDNDQGIVCESGCNFWFHRHCVGLSEAAFHMLTQAPYAEWVCDNCAKGKNIPPIKFTT